MRHLGRIDVQESDQASHPIAHDKGNEPIVLDDVDTPEVNELSLGSSPNLSSAKSSRDKSR